MKYETYRRAEQHKQLLADGREALGLMGAFPIETILVLVGTSRARLYRAMAAVRAIEAEGTNCDRRHEDSADSDNYIDPLLL
jgi:hypothetical protein